MYLGLVAEVADDLALLERVGVEDHELAQALLELRERGRDGHRRADLGHVRGGDVGIVAEVDELVGELDLLRVGGDDHLVARDREALLREREAHVLVVEHGLDHVGGIAVPDEPLAGGDGRLVLLVVELGDVLLPADHHACGLVDLLWLRGVERVAEELEGAADRLAHVAEEGHAALEGGRVEHLPAVDRRVADLVLAVGEARVGDGVRHAVFKGCVDGGRDVALVEVLLEVGELRVVELLDHLVLGHERDLVRRGHDDVVARGTRLELRVHGLVRVEGVHNDLAVVGLLEALDHVGRDVVAPGVDVEFLLRRAAAREDTACERDARQGFDGFHCSWSFILWVFMLSETLAGLRKSVLISRPSRLADGVGGGSRRNARRPPARR